MPCGVEHHFIPPIAITIMRVQDRCILIGIKAPTLRLLRAEQPAQLTDLLACPCGVLIDRPGQRPVTKKKVVAGERRDLVEGSSSASVAGTGFARRSSLADLSSRCGHSRSIMRQHLLENRICLSLSPSSTQRATLPCRPVHLQGRY